MAIYTDDPIKDPSDILDYKTDFANTTNGGTVKDFLQPGELIDSVSVVAGTGIDVHDGVTVYNGVTRPAPIAIDGDTSVIFWLSGGTHTKNYLVTVSITTTADRSVERSRLIQVRHI
jgi:hypothetical protein